jgi:hypothetical protein
MFELVHPSWEMVLRGLGTLADKYMRKAPACCLQELRLEAVGIGCEISDVVDQCLHKLQMATEQRDGRVVDF